MPAEMWRSRELAEGSKCKVLEFGVVWSAFGQSFVAAPGGWVEGAGAMEGSSSAKFEVSVSRGKPPFLQEWS